MPRALNSTLAICFDRSFLRRAIVAATLPLTALLGAAANAEWPDAPIKLIVPYVAGSAPDVVLRPVAQAMGRELNATIVVENRGGASGMIGTQAAARALPDGNTIAFGNVVTLAINPALYSNLSYDPVKDFQPLSLAIGNANALVARKDLPVNSVEELIAYAKKNPDQLTMGSAGVGSTGHLAGALMMSRTGIKMVHVPYKSGQQGVTNMLGGDIDIMFENLASILPYARNNQIKVLAVTSLQRAPSLPDTPTLDEQGLKGFEFVAWGGIIAPKGIPADVLKKLNKAVHKALQDPAVLKTNETFAVDVMPSTPEAFSELIASETPKWAQVVEQAQAKQN
jgi:tripartite-type tricarboxylate transporter receptor subunit TctC